MRKLSLVLAALGLVATRPALAQRSFSVGEEVFSESEILDARALPQLDGAPVILITWNEAAATRFRAAVRRSVGKPMAITLDGKALVTPIILEPNETSELQVSGDFTFAEASRLAKAISGKDPLPDSLEGE